MTLPEGVQPSGPTTISSVVVTPEEISDAQLRTWAKDHGIDGVPSGGRLSVAWRDQIVTAMVAALDPKDEASAEATSMSLFSPETTVTSLSEEEDSPITVVEEIRSVQPEFDNLHGEYRSVFRAPDTFVSGQIYTA